MLKKLVEYGKSAISFGCIISVGKNDKFCKGLVGEMKVWLSWEDTLADVTPSYSLIGPEKTAGWLGKTPFIGPRQVLPHPPRIQPPVGLLECRAPAPDRMPGPLGGCSNHRLNPMMIVMNHERSQARLGTEYLWISASTCTVTVQKYLNTWPTSCYTACSMPYRLPYTRC